MHSNSETRHTNPLAHHPLDHPGVSKIVVSEDVAEVLESIGEHCLVISTKADSTVPRDIQGRTVFCCLPITRELADDLWRLAIGTHKATKIKPAPTPRP